MNNSIFLVLNAGSDPNSAVLVFALFLSKFLPYLLMGFCGLAFILGSKKIRVTLLTIALAALVATIVSWLIGHYAYTPRPFVQGIGHVLLAHTDNASFPSNHMMFMSIFATMFMVSGQQKIGVLFTCLAVAVGWSRIYLGVHYPMDILGGALIGVMVSILVWKAIRPRFLN